MRALLAFALLTFASLTACDHHEPQPTAVASASAVAAVSSAPPKRPTRRYYFGEIGGRCEVYFIDGDEVSAPLRATCPVDLFAGERIRIAGKTCTRESSDPARRVPVVCPDPLTNLEKREQAKVP